MRAQRPVLHLRVLSANPRLKALAQPLLDEAVAAFESTGQKQRLFTTFGYRADTWDRDRTVVAKAECHAPGTNLRFVVTNLPTRRSRHRGGTTTTSSAARASSGWTS